MRLALLYSLFAAISTVANIGAQDVWVRLWPWARGGILTSMAFGTLVGLVVKYVLDKKWIFRFRADNLAHDSRTFLLYSLMGVLTTIIFWGVELGFEWAFKTDAMRYLGGVIGLMIGYIIKYQLDKRYVFRRE